MGCCSAGPYQADGRNSAELAKKGGAQEDVRNAIHDDEEGIAEEVKDHMPEPALPTLLESAFQLARSHDDNLDTLSSVSSRPTTVLSIPTPSIQASNFDSLANSSIRAEFDKESARYSFSAPSEQLQGAPSVGAPSECGTRDEFPGVTSMSQSHSVGAPSVFGTIDNHSESVARVPSGCANYPSQSIGVPSICSNFDAEGAARPCISPVADRLASAAAEQLLNVSFDSLQGDGPQTKRERAPGGGCKPSRPSGHAMTAAERYAKFQVANPGQRSHRTKASGSASSVPGSPSSPGASPPAASSEESNSDEVVGGVVGGVDDATFRQISEANLELQVVIAEKDKEITSLKRQLAVERTARGAKRMCKSGGL